MCVFVSSLFVASLLDVSVDKCGLLKEPRNRATPATVMVTAEAPLESCRLWASALRRVGGLGKAQLSSKVRVLVTRDNGWCVWFAVIAATIVTAAAAEK